MDVKQSQKAGNNAIQIQQTVVGDNNYVVGIEIENDSRKPNDNQPKRSLLRRLAAFLNDMVAEIIDALELLNDPVLQILFTGVPAGRRSNLL